MKYYRKKAKNDSKKFKKIKKICFFSVEFPVERSNFRSNVQISGRTFENPVERSKFKTTGHPKISLVLRISGRTFEFLVERS